jgi:hypothetical protein
MSEKTTANAELAAKIKFLESLEEGFESDLLSVKNHLDRVIRYSQESIKAIEDTIETQKRVNGHLCPYEIDLGFLDWHHSALKETQSHVIKAREKGIRYRALNEKGA